MKILMATMGLDIGGAETHIVELSKELKHQGHEVVIVSNGGVYEREVEAAGIRHYKAPLNRRSLGDMRRGKAVLRQAIEQEKPDVIHAHARIPGFLCGQLHKKLGVPFVTSCHGVYQVTGPLRLLSDWGQRTLAVSEDIKTYLEEEYHIPSDHITITINGIDTEKFSPKVSGTRIRQELGLGDGPVLVHVCRLDAFTAPTARQLIHLAPVLSQAIPGLRMVLVGGGEVYEELKAKAEAANREIGRECLTLTGPRTDINEIVAACDLFVGVSRAALEAMAAGKPAVLSGAQGHTGLFVPELLNKAMDTNFCCRTDPIATDDQLVEAVKAGFALSPEEREELGTYGRQVVREHYSVNRMAQDCLDMYRQVCQKPHRIVMSGYYGFNNAGDDAILESILKALRETSDQVDVTVLSNDPDQTRSRYGVHAVSRFSMKGVADILRHSDALLFGGGSLLQDSTSTRSLFYYLSVIRMAQHLHKPVMLYANGIGPVCRKRNRRWVKKVVERADLVTLRDHSSKEELEKMGVPAQKLQVTADPVFCMDPAPQERAEELLSTVGMDQDTNFVAVSVRNWRDTETFFQGLAKFCDELHRRHGLEVLFLPMQQEKDMEPSRRVQALMEEPSFLMEESCTPRELMAVMGMGKLCLAMRLHTLIFAARVAVPSLGLVYDPKVASYLDELGLPAAGTVEHFDADQAIQRADQLLADYDNVLEHLRERSAQLTDAAHENVRLLLELLDK